MKRIFVLAAVVATSFGVGGTITTPASAAVPYCDKVSGYNHGDFQRNDQAYQQFNRFSIMAELKRRGVPVEDVDEWNGCIQAYVPNGTGGTSMQFYDPDTYQRIYTDSDKK